jgi:hypothetical protein
MSIAKDRVTGKPVFQFIRFEGVGETKGGAFLQFEINLKLPDEVKRKIISKIPSVFGEWAKGMSTSKINLTPAEWDDGTVECMVLDLRSGSAGDGVSAQAQNGGEGVRFVEAIRSSAKPSLDGLNSAIFSVEMGEEGAQIVDQMLEQRLSPIGVFYSLKYTGLQPSFKAHIEANMENVYQTLRAKVTGQYKFLKGGIEAGVEEAIRKKDIKIDFSNYMAEKGANDALEKWVLDFFTEYIVKEWMRPVLTPGVLAGSKENTVSARASDATPAAPTNPKSVEWRKAQDESHKETVYSHIDKEMVRENKEAEKEMGQVHTGVSGFPTDEPPEIDPDPPEEPESDEPEPDEPEPDSEE